jgi:hypothetical protein
MESLRELCVVSKLALSYEVLIVIDGWELGKSKVSQGITRLS